MKWRTLLWGTAGGVAIYLVYLVVQAVLIARGGL